jgi:hypothetical protein
MNQNDSNIAISDSNDGQYSTKNSALTAYLYMSGFELIDVDNSSFPTVFSFKLSDELKKHVKMFQTGEVPFPRFFEAYRLVIRMTKVGKL